MWNAHNIVLGDEALLIYIVPVCYVKTGRHGKKTSNIIITLHRKNVSIITNIPVIMVALCNRADHYIFALWFLSSFFLSFFLFFFPRLISAVADWMSAILPHMVWPSANLRCRSETCCTRPAENTKRKNDAKNRHLGIIAQLCWAMSSQQRHV